MADHEDAEFQRLLKNAFQDEALRRMARKAGVHGASRKETDDVNQALRALGYRILDNFCEKLAVYTEHRKSKTVSEQDFRNTCDLLKIKLDFYATPSRENNTFPRCKAYSPGRVVNRRVRGTRADLETQHENRYSAADCVYNEQLPFARLVRDIMENHYRGVRFTPQTLSWLQYMAEYFLIKVLTAAGKIVQDTTVGPRGGKSRATLSYRDVAAVVDTLQLFPSCVPVFGDSREIRRAGQAGGGREGRRGEGRGKGRGRGRGRGRGPGGGEDDDEGGDEGGGDGGPDARGRGGGRRGSGGRGRSSEDGRGRGRRGSRGGGGRGGSGRGRSSDEYARGRGSRGRGRRGRGRRGRGDQAPADLAVMYDKLPKDKGSGMRSYDKDKRPKDKRPKDKDF